MTDTDTAKTVTVTISVSTDTRTAHIGRYFVDVRDTTAGRNRQMTARAADVPGVFDFLGELRKAAHAAGVRVIVRDKTDELGI